METPYGKFPCVLGLVRIPETFTQVTMEITMCTDFVAWNKITDFHNDNDCLQDYDCLSKITYSYKNKDFLRIRWFPKKTQVSYKNNDLQKNNGFLQK